jgi:hypothetical protein
MTGYRTALPRLTDKVRGLRARASRKSRAALNEATALDVGDPGERGRDYARVKGRLRHLNVMGACCGTDHRHVEQIASTCLPLSEMAT